MAGVDQDKVRKLSSELRRALALLEELRRMDRQVLLADEHRKGSAKYHFIVAIEAAVDLCSHLVSAMGLRSPESYADTLRCFRRPALSTRGSRPG